MRASIYLIDRASAYATNWNAVRASFGMNGIFMPSSELDAFADYLVGAWLFGRACAKRNHRLAVPRRRPNLSTPPLAVARVFCEVFREVLCEVFCKPPPAVSCPLV